MISNDGCFSILAAPQSSRGNARSEKVQGRDYPDKLVPNYCSMRDLAIGSRAEADGWIALPRRTREGKINGLHAGRAKCPGRYSLEELFWLNATVFCLQVSLLQKGILTRLPIRSPMRF